VCVYDAAGDEPDLARLWCVVVLTIDADTMVSSPPFEFDSWNQDRSSLGPYLSRVIGVSTLL
jgi:hypothetical protein